MGTDTLSEEATLSKLCCLPSENGSIKKERICSQEKKYTLKRKCSKWVFFPFKVNLFFKGLYAQKSKQKVTKVVSLEKMTETILSISSPLNTFMPSVP